jgi:hypothetical protein
MAGPLRWVLFFAVIILAGAAVTALWVGWSEDLLKSLVTFAVVALAFVALFALAKRAYGTNPTIDLTIWSDYMVRHDHTGEHRRSQSQAFRAH